VALIDASLINFAHLSYHGREIVFATNIIRRRWPRAATLTLLCCLTSTVIAAPVIQGTSGTFNHESTVTITGSGFGTKPQAAPLIWDDASKGNVPADNAWTDAWPNTTDSSTAYTRYTTPIRGTPLPHGHVNRYIAGAHGTGGWTLSVTLHKAYNITSFPQPVFISYYYRVDDNWNFCSGDNNFKLGSHAVGVGPYSDPYWYYEHRNPDFTANSTPGIYTPYIPSSSGRTHTFFNGTATNPKGRWVKIEYEALYSPQSNGYVKIWDDGRLGTQYNGVTDPSSATGTRTEAIGGYARCSGYTSNWRYFADVYLDTSRARVVLANAANYNQASIREVQIPSSWSNNSINVSVNLGKFSSGQTAYLFVVDSNGTVSASGLPITIGSGSGSAQLPAPSNLTVK
jgi:hypothetical protein